MSCVPGHAGVFGNDVDDVLADSGRCRGETPMMRWTDAGREAGWGMRSPMGHQLEERISLEPALC